jgi:hypothetical protein
MFEIGKVIGYGVVEVTGQKDGSYFLKCACGREYEEKVCNVNRLPPSHCGCLGRSQNVHKTRKFFKLPPINPTIRQMMFSKENQSSIRRPKLSCSGCKYDPTYDEQREGIICKDENNKDGVCQGLYVYPKIYDECDIGYEECYQVE